MQKSCGRISGIKIVVNQSTVGANLVCCRDSRQFTLADDYQ